MTDDQINDLKQFMTTLISQQVTSQADGLREEMQTGLGIVREEMQVGFGVVHEEIRALDKKLSGKIDDLANYIGDALDTSNEETGKQLKDHEHRITKLEIKAA